VLPLVSLLDTITALSSLNSTVGRKAVLHTIQARTASLFVSIHPHDIAQFEPKLTCLLPSTLIYTLLM